MGQGKTWQSNNGLTSTHRQPGCGVVGALPGVVGKGVSEQLSAADLPFIIPRRETESPLANDERIGAARYPRWYNVDWCNRVPRHEAGHPFLYDA